jgi:hypothetical protein
MKYYFFFIIFAAGLCAVLASSCAKKVSDKPLTIYDTSLLMLAEFIKEGPDSNLGFSNFDELDHIHLGRPINVYRLLEDSLVTDLKDTLVGTESLHADHHLILEGRKIFPVFYLEKLRSAITFDTTPFGWRPTYFDDSNVFREIQADEVALKDSLEKDSTEYGVMVAPSIQDYIALKRTKKGDYILPRKELSIQMQENYPSSGQNAFAPIKKSDFYEGLRKHILKKRRLHRKKIS